RDAVFVHELATYALNPLRSRNSAFYDTSLFNSVPVNHNDHSRLIHHAYHSWKDPFKSLGKTLQIKWLLKARNLKDGIAVQENLVDIAGVRLCVSEADAEGFGINTGQSADESLALRSQDADVLLEKVREFLHEFPAGSRRQLSSTFETC